MPTSTVEPHLTCTVVTVATGGTHPKHHNVIRGTHKIMKYGKSRRQISRDSNLLPGVFLLLVNGIGSLLGGIASFSRHRFAGEIAAGLGTFLVLWIAVQVWWMGVHWLHMLYFVAGIVELTLGLKYRANQGTSG